MFGLGGKGTNDFFSVTSFLGFSVCLNVSLSSTPSYFKYFKRQIIKKSKKNAKKEGRQERRQADRLPAYEVDFFFP